MKTIHAYGIPTLLLIVGALLWLVQAQLLILAWCSISAGALWFLGSLWKHYMPAIEGTVHTRLAVSAQEHQQWSENIDKMMQYDLQRYAIANGKDIERESNGTMTIKAPARVQVSEVQPLQIDGPKEWAMPVAPSFAQIVHQIAPGHLFLGQSINGPIWGGIVDLLSTLIAGRPGTGKSTQLRNVCGQILKVQGQPVIFDPHGSIVDDLGNVFQCAETPDDITDQSKWIAGQLDTRLIQRRAGQSQFKPMLLLVDEMPIVASMSALALEAIRRIVLEGRKVGMFALISGQGVPASILGGTLVRDAMSSRYVFCTSPQQARMAGIENETAKRLMTLLEEAGPGKAVMATASRKPEIVAVPYTSTDDIRLLVPRNTGTLIRNNSTVPDFGNVRERLAETPPYGFPAVSGTLEASDATTNGPSPEEREQIIELAKAGMPRRDICKGLGLGKWYYDVVKQVLDEEGL